VTFTDATLPQWTHTLDFTPAAASISSATLQLRHAGNKANDRNGSSGEFWLLTSAGNTFIGNLSLSWSLVDFFVTDTFTLPASLLPSLPVAGSWALAVKLGESTNQTDSITLDWARLNVTYEPVATMHTPEPATLALLGTGLAAVAWRRRRQQRARDQ
jgi:PEP-CTERM motif